MQRIFLTLCLSLLLLIPVIAQDPTPEPNLSEVIGLSVPQAEATLNRLGYRLNAVLISDFSSANPVNTVIDYTITEGNQVTLTIAREANIQLVWDISEYLANASFLGNLDGDELFTIVNLSENDIALQNIQIADFEAGAWGNTLRARQCAQIWTFPEDNAYSLPDCQTVQGGILNLTNEIQQFWRNQDNFDILQNGIHRATCQQSEGLCTFWLSPTEIAEDIAPYIYLIYDETQWIAYNNSEQWMDLSQMMINNLPTMSDVRNWDIVNNADLERLAPNQCVRFTQDIAQDSLIDCDEVAVQAVTADRVFWISPFILADSLNGNNTYQCPPSLGERTICLLGR